MEPFLIQLKFKFEENECVNSKCKLARLYITDIKIQYRSHLGIETTFICDKSTKCSSFIFISESNAVRWQ